MPRPPIVLFALVLFVAVMVSSVDATTPAVAYYKVAPGDTLHSIARTFDTTVNRLIALNQGVNPTNLQVGQEITVLSGTTGKVPKQTRSSQEQPVEYFIHHQVQRGDTLASIARNYSVPQGVIAKANNLTESNLRVGRIVRIPVGDPTKSIPYYIERGDTLYRLAREYNTTVAILREANYNIHPDELAVGSRLSIPVAKTHVVRTGETLRKVAERYSMTIEELAKLNKLEVTDLLLIGQKLIIQL